MIEFAEFYDAVKNLDADERAIATRITEEEKALRTARSAYRDAMLAGNKKQMADLEKQVATVNTRLSLLKESNQDRIKDLNAHALAVITKDPDSDLSRLAEEAQDKGLACIESHRRDINGIMAEIEQAKQAYMGILGRLGDALRAAAGDTIEALKVQKFLPKDRQERVPMLRNPDWGLLDMDIDTTAKAMGRLPMWSLMK
ncbi:hypothetical protein Dalk_5232 [Desulfatibacillum aliphaticivorans]|uniref:Uncharacterized protein n=1 Tax=Desulfatibacillum aliphaticivorans TaxID=218208 RepID=B8FEC1_DESAL|nr:hypothetical protein [Desulfatibacillum aliphaticivorans]ACL06902.1 hypothetical protein Dalk_5232 [Desulfatibacillum aliphaticivorans]